MATIFDVNSWSASTQYKKHYFIKNGDNFYYSTQFHISSSDFTTDLNAGLWNGMITINSELKPYFLWLPDYGFDNLNEPRIKNIRFGDGYAQDIPDGINNNLLQFDFTFDNRSLDEATAILHFFYVRGGVESFIFLPPAPYATLKRFKVKSWTDSQKFYENYVIKAKFEEVNV